MRLTQFSDYSLRVLLYLGQCNDRLATIAEIAEWYGVSKAHLVKVVHKLATLGYVSTVQGKGGGVRLGKPANEITVAQVIRDTEPDFHTVECFAVKANTCRVTSTCRLKHVLREATEAFQDTLGRYSLADIANPTQTNFINQRSEQ